MQLRIITLGEVKSSEISALEAEYLKRIKKLARLEIYEIPTKKLAPLNGAERKKAEAALLLERLQKEEQLYILDERGRQFTSTEFASAIERQMSAGTRKLALAIGGVFGWDQTIYDKADLKLSLSSLTFTSELARLVLIEQLYRAYTIINNIPYHKS